VTFVQQLYYRIHALTNSYSACGGALRIFVYIPSVLAWRSSGGGATEEYALAANTRDRRRREVMRVGSLELL